MGVIKFKCGEFVIEAANAQFRCQIGRGVTYMKSVKYEADDESKCQLRFVCNFGEDYYDLNDRIDYGSATDLALRKIKKWRVI